MIEVLIGLLVLVLVIWFTIWVFMLIADMATLRNRNAIFWVLLALAWSPFGSIILLWLLGDAACGTRD